MSIDEISSCRASSSSPSNLLTNPTGSTCPCLSIPCSHLRSLNGNERGICLFFLSCGHEKRNKTAHVIFDMCYTRLLHLSCVLGQQSGPGQIQLSMGPEI
eukprot:TRINITY_DN10145_c0_g1_i1.p1 TRINITY_DN10145_c0_g1~~TRINITY_DN10145_c0_g1_i1.p1  ORF type:complete len:100 (-),score=7.30 TRINITY_DN10145_c0_g1_i1:593-892(-)